MTIFWDNFTRKFVLGPFFPFVYVISVPAKVEKPLLRKEESMYLLFIEYERNGLIWLYIYFVIYVRDVDG